MISLYYSSLDDLKKSLESLGHEVVIEKIGVEPVFGINDEYADLKFITRRKLIDKTLQVKFVENFYRFEDVSILLLEVE